ncbi:MAG: methyltransferase type 11 [Bacteroidetes bacterium GWF2_42_66]|nr:MAG: methyltransferase type 11 [Bacteroidetes bacterium GWA2_42_15]OFX98488.1 MAG: methyltransferase type 11 [Bacteroidetes bacterium GWE2_42_39]OFY42873.1 MAG: methyltransferase type 11 [Bacteroidetes bacterium GWF2_42_66]HBL75331.1 methyltransferase type 11 [Prolixibacteraceae bacterium]HCR91484.1 methyltransferase type 11 [Prolixibacteraceae bacterium]
MQYDPIKRSLGRFFNRLPVLRKLFYRLLDWLLLRSWHIRKELRQLKNEGLSAPVIFDAGSGFGQYSYRMAKMFPKASIVAADIKEEQIADCKDFFSKTGLAERVRFRLADLTKYAVTDKYDLIISVDVMEHIEEDRKVFSNFCKSIKPGGVLLISTPSDQGGSDTHDHEEGVHGFIDEHVRDGYNILEIEEKLLTAGFRMVEARYSYGTPGKISWKLSMKYPILMLGFSKLFFIILPFYYMVTFPFSVVLNYLDISTKHKTGTGLIVKATK